MVRAAMSIPTNIVEGSSQDGRREFGRFLRYAANSATELEYHLMVAHDIRAISLHDYAALSEQTVEIRKMLRGLLTRVSAS
jgi:four helix bundle protein